MNLFYILRASKQLEHIHGPEWKGKVSPPESLPSNKSATSQATVDGVLTHPTPTQATSEDTNQPQPPQLKINGTTTATHPTPIQATSEGAHQPHLSQPKINVTTTTATQSTPITHDTIGNTSTAQSSPPQDATGSTSATTHPSPVTDSSTVEAPVDPAVRFAQCKDQGNSFVKQVGIWY